VTDSHCHLAGEEFAGDLEAVVARARETGVSRALVILAADDDAEVERAARVEHVWPTCRFAVGVHPHNAHRFADDPAAAADLVARRLDQLTSARAVGEIGLDYHYDFSPPDVQHAVFRHQLRLARARRLPVVIHTREAELETLQILREEGPLELSGVFHCFTSDIDSANRALGAGFYLSLPGILTFPKAGALREVARTVPLDRLLIETDSPYLAPVPHRGKRNEPAFVARVAEQLAHERGVDRATIDQALDRNFDTLFKP
jgi:TatD DNase family protein